MREEPQIDSSYSRYEEDITNKNKLIEEHRAKIAEFERDVVEMKAKIEEIKTDPSYGDEEKVEAIKDYEKSIKIAEDTIKLIQENIGLCETITKMDQTLKNDSEELLKTGESLDPLIADIEMEDKPHRTVN